jgi:REP element-mobilizing transposase RayT
LPHLYKPGGTYFVTFRLADAVVPAAERVPTLPSIDPDADWGDALPADIARSHEPPLAAGSCALRDPAIGKVVQDAMLHFSRQRYELLAWCVMPNHTHAVMTPLGGYAPDRIMHSWKSFTAHEANKRLGRTGTFWERESFDHLVRNVNSLEGFIRYTEQNPVEAGLCARAAEWPFSSARCSLLGTAD